MSTEENEFYVDYWFDVELSRLDGALAKDIMRQLGKIMRTLPEKEDVSQVIGGVSLIGEPVYFMVEYLNERNYEPVLEKLSIVDVDTYLDLMNLSKTIKNDPQTIKRRRRNTTKVYNKE
jgi:hypothetical protein